MKYKIKPYDEVNDVYLLYRHSWWIFYNFVSAGSKQKLEDFVKKQNGVIV
jgi:hypothetical protein